MAVAHHLRAHSTLCIREQLLTLLGALVTLAAGVFAAREGTALLRRQVISFASVELCTNIPATDGSSVGEAIFSSRNISQVSLFAPLFSNFKFNCFAVLDGGHYFGSSLLWHCAGVQGVVSARHSSKMLCCQR
jgi:hypothetical protein